MDDTLTDLRLPMGRPSPTETRTPQQLRQHYDVERRLADRLRRSTKDERQCLYSTLYDELYRRVPHHPQLTRKASLAAQREAIASRMRLLRRFLYPFTTFLEIGPGDCSLSLEVAKRSRRVYAVDVSTEITQAFSLPDNFALLISDGSSIPVPPSSVDVAYSYQLIEHLHPSDAVEHVQNVYRALVPNGIYICVTPNRLNGPHDISKYFDRVASGFHLKEYTTGELVTLFEGSGFSQVQPVLSAKGHLLPFPTCLVRWIETLLGKLPYSVQVRVAHWRPIRLLLGIMILARR